MKVWFKLDDFDAEIACLSDGACAYELKSAVKNQRADTLKDVDEGDLSVFSLGNRLAPGELVPVNTSFEAPIMVKTPDRPNKKTKKSLPYDDMMTPEKIRPPTPPDLPKFVGPDDWKLSVRETVQRKLSLADFETSKSHRVEPLAVSRCSRGGKTRALYEIGNLEYKYNDEAVPVIFVSFNDYSTLNECDQEDPLQALILRIVFAAHRGTTYNCSTGTQFKKFRETFDVTENDVMCWLGDAPALLIVDELNNLRKLTARDADSDKQAAKFANFIKSYFVKPAGRYFVFSTHIVSTLECFGVFMEYNTTSERGGFVARVASR